MSGKVLVQYTCANYLLTRAKKQRDIWMGNVPIPIQTVIGYDRKSDKDIAEFGHNVKVLSCNDSYQHLVYKTQAMIDWFVKETNYDVLIKMDDDVWVSDSAMNDIISSNEKYGGVMCYDAYYIPYHSGGLYWIHRDLAKRLANLPTSYNFAYKWPRHINMPEDMAVGAVLKSIGVKLTDVHKKYNVYYGDGINPPIPEGHEFDIGISTDKINPSEVLNKLHLNKRK